MKPKRRIATDAGRLLVVDDGRIVGLIARTGITRFLQIRAELDGDAEPGGEFAADARG